MVRACASFSFVRAPPFGENLKPVFLDKTNTQMTDFLPHALEKFQDFAEEKVPALQLFNFAQKRTITGQKYTGCALQDEWLIPPI
jgi:hypothetical protein